LNDPIEGDSIPANIFEQLEVKHVFSKRTRAYFKEVIIPNTHNFLAPTKTVQRCWKDCAKTSHLLTIIALSSMMHPEPMTIGPATAKIVALG